jgi:hypothetical protein
MQPHLRLALAALSFAGLAQESPILDQIRAQQAPNDQAFS